MLGSVRRLAAISALVLGSSTSIAHAQAPDLSRLIDNLKNGADFRIRTQAALALGASKSTGAIAPLCTALSDSNTTVRAASAAALGKLSLGGKECLSSRLGSEPSETVKAAIQKALQQLEGGAEPVIDASTKYYVQLGAVADKSGRSDGSVDRLFRQAFLEAAAGAGGGIVFAPMTETPDKAKKRLAGKTAKAFFLSPRVPQFEYAGGNLTVKVEIAVFTYPGKALLGSFTRKASIGGVSPGDSASEDELLRYVGESALKVFNERAAQFQ